MTTTTRWNANMFAALKLEVQASEMAVLMGEVLEDQIQGVKDSNPGLAERMSK
jgi:hypothetical protein